MKTFSIIIFFIATFMAMNTIGQITNGRITYHELINAANPNLKSDFHGHITLQDPVFPDKVITFSNEIFNQGPSTGKSRIRVQGHKINTSSVFPDISFLPTGQDDIFMTDVSAFKYNNPGYIVCGHANVSLFGNRSDMFLWKSNVTFNTSSVDNYTQISLGINGFSFTYALDVLAREFSPGYVIQNTEEAFYVVGFVSDGPASLTSQKIPYVACFKYDMSISWVKYLNMNPGFASSVDVFNCITAVDQAGFLATNGILVTGTTMQDMYGTGTYDKAITNILFDYSGNEFNHNFHLTNNTGPSNNDNSVVSDVVYDGKHAYILSNQKANNGITIGYFDCSTFTSPGAITARLIDLSSGNSYDAHGFNFQVKPNNKLGVVGLFNTNIGFGSGYNVFNYEYDKIQGTTSVLPSGQSFIGYHISAKVGSFSGFNSYFDYASGGGPIQPESFVPNMSHWTSTYGEMFGTNFQHVISGSSPSITDGYTTTVCNSTQPYLPGINQCSNTLLKYAIGHNASHNKSLSTSITMDYVLTNALSNESTMNESDFIERLCGHQDNKTSGIENVKKESPVLFPNPAGEYTMLNIVYNDEVYSIQLINASGQIFEIPVVQSQEGIRCNLSNISSGIYQMICRDSQSNMISQSKIIKE